MKFPTRTLLASLIALSSLCTAGAHAETPDVVVKLSTMTLTTGEELTVTISSTEFCHINLQAMGLDDAAPYKEIKPLIADVINPPRHYKFKFPKPGKYRIYAGFSQMYCGNMQNQSVMNDITVTRPKIVFTSTVPPVVVVPKPAPPSTPVKPCKKAGKPGVGNDCSID